MVATRRRRLVKPGSGDERPPPSKKAKAEHTRDKDGDGADDAPQAAQGKKKTQRRKKNDAIKEPDPADYPERVSSPWKVGFHASAEGGVANSISNAAASGANAIALFVKPQLKWTGPALKPETVATFKTRLAKFNYAPRHVLPHGSYLTNLGNPDDEKREKSYECFLDELRRCEELGLELYNFHPGSTVGVATPDHSISLIAECINRAHKATRSIFVVLENMAGAGNVIGSSFDELADIILEVKDKSRVAVCLDTCHMFAAGYDIRTKEGWDTTVAEFDQKVGLSYLRGLHLNDSKAALGAKKDRHENIGLGQLGLKTFHHILTDPRMQDLPMILETPQHGTTDVVKAEIEALNRLSSVQWPEGGAGEAFGENWVEEIRKAIKEATKKKSTSRVKPPTKKDDKRKKGGTKKEDDSDEEEIASSADGDN